MACQWHPTFLSVADGWIAADSDIYPVAECWKPSVPWMEDPPAWAGEPRGLFTFPARATPARTHGGLPTQAAIEARLGRSIPDPSEGSRDVFYWNVQPLLFHVRNQSGETVSAVFSRGGGCSSFSQDVLDTEELIIGPFYGDLSFPVVQLVGATAGPEGVPTVGSGVDVRVTEAALADPGESFANFDCEDPAVVAA